MIIRFDQNPPIDAVGCKGHNLARMWQAGLPVPAGFCVSWDGIASVDVRELESALRELGKVTYAVRSSALQEDSGVASFAGILVSRLNVPDPAGVLSVLDEVRDSASAPAVEEYSHRRNVPATIRVAAIVQTFIPADAAGVLFMRDPLTGAHNAVVEACWGLGQGVVEGLVRPDRWILSSNGAIISSQIADKDIAIIPAEYSGVKEMRVDPSCRRRACLTMDQLHALLNLASRCEQLFGTAQDIEWAIASDRIWLLQSRPITASRNSE